MDYGIHRPSEGAGRSISGEKGSEYDWVNRDRTVDGGASPPPMAMHKLYQIAKGYGIRRSMERLSNFYRNGDRFAKILSKYKEVSESNGGSGYRNLMKAVAEVDDVEYNYVETEVGHRVEVKGSEGKWWQFPVKRGEHRDKEMEHQLQRDYDNTRINKNYHRVKGMKGKGTMEALYEMYNVE